MMIFIGFLIILCNIALLYGEFKKLREEIEKYYEKTNGYITQLCDLIDRNSGMEEKILNEIADKLEKRGNE